jgi:hypothetical protein
MICWSTYPLRVPEQLSADKVATISYMGNRKRECLDV